MMKRITIVISVLVCIYFDSIFFVRLNIAGIRPDVLLAVVVSYGVLLGHNSGMLIGAVAGLAMDILFGEFIGLNTLLYFLIGLAASTFYRRYYADNVIVPALTALVTAFGKELIVCAVAAVTGVRFGFGRMLIVYILPCAIFTALVCAGVHAILKPIMSAQSAKRNDHLHLS